MESIPSLDLNPLSMMSPSSAAFISSIGFPASRTPTIPGIICPAAAKILGNPLVIAVVTDAVTCVVVDSLICGSASFMALSVSLVITSVVAE